MRGTLRAMNNARGPRVNNSAFGRRGGASIARAARAGATLSGS